MQTSSYNFKNKEDSVDCGVKRREAGTETERPSSRERRWSESLGRQEEREKVPRGVSADTPSDHSDEEAE